MYPTECLNMITASGLPLHKLTLKVGSPVMVLCNHRSLPEYVRPCHPPHQQSGGGYHSTVGSLG
jgi:hypothetical protein